MPLPLIVILLAALLILLFWHFSGLVAIAHGTPSVWTPKDEIRKGLRLAQLKIGEQLADLGCGDGRVLEIAVREFGARATGFEVAPWAYLLASLRRLSLPSKLRSRVSLRFKNFFGADLSRFDIIWIYLLSGEAGALKEKLCRELRPDCRIVAYDIPMPGWKGRKEGKHWLYRKGKDF